MSFYYEFNAENAEHAKSIVLSESIPDSVKLFIIDALKGIGGSAVHVKAQGHLCSNGDSSHSTAQIEVGPILMRGPVGGAIKSR